MTAPTVERSFDFGRISSAKICLFSAVGFFGAACTEETTNASFSHGDYDITANARLNDIVPTIVNVDWETETAGYSHIIYGIDGELTESTPINEIAMVDHEMAMIGLKAGETYSYQVVTMTESGTELVSEVNTIELDPVPAELPRVTISSYDENASQEGGFMLYSLVMSDDTWTVIVDRDGDYVWYAQGGEKTIIPTSKVGLDGMSILFTENDSAQTDDVSTVTRIAMDGSSQTVTEVASGHHDFAELGDGNFGYLGMDFQMFEIDGENLEIAGDTIVEISEGSNRDGSNTEVFNAFDEYGEPWRPCTHFDGGAYGYPDMRDWTHANSIVYDQEEEAFYVMAKNLDAIWKIDRYTGALLWEMGGYNSDFSWETTTQPWSHAHMSQMWSDGLVMFDNGFHHEKQVSRIVEYAYNDETMTMEEVFSYSDPDGAFSPLLGDVKKLPEGNYIASWMVSGRLTEITPQGDVVWQADMEVGNATSRVTWIEDLYDMQTKLHW